MITQSPNNDDHGYLYNLNMALFFVLGWSATSRESTSSTRASCKRVRSANDLLGDDKRQPNTERSFAPYQRDTKDFVTRPVAAVVLESHTVTH